MTVKSGSDYMMGHNDRERRRLVLQATILNPITDGLLRRAGLSNGMRVLDLGCGVGDVSLLSARLVGRHGNVLAVDIDATALEIARDRAQSQGLSNIEFKQAKAGELHGLGPFDAVTGRHILIHVPQPQAVLQDVFNLLRSGGVAIFQEYDFSSHSPPLPKIQLVEQLLDMFNRVFAAGSAHPAIGAQLYQLMSLAGFVSLDARVEYSLDGSPDSPYYEWLVESIRAVLPRARSMGLTGAAEIDIDALEQRLREEVLSQHAAASSPTMFGIFGRKP